MNGVLFTLLFVVCCAINCAAQPVTDKDNNMKSFYIAPQAELLRSTHKTYFSGGRLEVGKTIKPSIDIGVGVEYVMCKYHPDNLWDLYNLKCIPVFINAKYKWRKSKIFSQFFELSQGVSFNSYRKEDQLGVFSPYHVSEAGYYVYGGTGAFIRIRQNIRWLVSIGFKGYRMSFNALDVNPHGLNFSSGFKIEL